MCVSYALSFIFSQQNGPHFRHLLGFLILGIPYTPIFSGHIKFSKVLHNTKQPESSCNVQICQDFRGLISSCIYYHLHFQVISSYIKPYIPRFSPFASRTSLPPVSHVVSSGIAVHDGMPAALLSLGTQTQAGAVAASEVLGSCKGTKESQRDKNSETNRSRS